MFETADHDSNCGFEYSSDSNEFFDVDIGVIQTGGSFYKLISYNRFILSYYAMKYLYRTAQSEIGIYISMRRLELLNIIMSLLFFS